MDAGDVHASVGFRVSSGQGGNGMTKSGLYANGVVDAAMRGIHEALAQFKVGVSPTPLDYTDPSVRGSLMPKMTAKEREPDFEQTAADVTRLIRASDGQPGALATFAGGGERVFLHNPVADAYHAPHTQPGKITGTRDDAVRIQCGRGSVWVSALRRKGKGAFKLPAAACLQLRGVPEVLSPPLFYAPNERPNTFQEVWVNIDGDVAHVHWEFYNGAMSTRQCERLTRALEAVRTRKDISVVVLFGGADYFSNGVHLNTIEVPSSHSLTHSPSLTSPLPLRLRLTRLRSRGRTSTPSTTASRPSSP